MTNQYSTGSSPVRISASTAVKIGFFGSLGALLFSLIVSVVFGVIVLVLLALGVGGGLFHQLGLN